MVDRTKLPFRIGDTITTKNYNSLAGVIIGYHFPEGYNKYNYKVYGYTIKLLGERYTGHMIGNCTYNIHGEPINDTSPIGYWWIMSHEATLVRRSIKFILTL